MATSIDFKKLRQSLSFETVLRHYGVKLKIKGTQHHGYCPLPNHQGKKNSPSFSANLEKGIFQCFGCGAKGNVLEFAALMDKIDPADGTELRKVALGQREQFCPASLQPELSPAPTKQKQVEPAKKLSAVVRLRKEFKDSSRRNVRSLVEKSSFASLKKSLGNLTCAVR